jgi:hypothetical protein
MGNQGRYGGQNISQGQYPIHQSQDQGFGRNYGHHRQGYHQHGVGGQAQYGQKYKYQASQEVHVQKIENEEISYGGPGESQENEKERVGPAQEISVEEKMSISRELMKMYKKKETNFEEKANLVIKGSNNKDDAK